MDSGCGGLINKLTLHMLLRFDGKPRHRNRRYQTQRVTDTWDLACSVKPDAQNTSLYFSYGLPFSDLLSGSSLVELGLYEGVTLRMSDFVEPERGGRATSRGRAVIWNSSENASCIMFVSVFSSKDSAKLPNSDILEHKAIF